VTYSTPARIDELTTAQLNAWNQTLSKMFDQQIAIAKAERSPPSAVSPLFNPITHGGRGLAEASISWVAFPKRVASEAPTPVEAWKRADQSRNVQTEYCEWEVVRDPNNAGKVVRVTFTCEAEDYYRFLSKENPDLLLSLYHRHVSPTVQLADLMRNGAYDPQNRWNYPQLGGARGILMHMGQINNSFEAAVNLGAVASWPRVNASGQMITGEQALIACRSFGDAAWHSDPHIGAEINSLVRSGNEFSFADPVGLYIDSIDLSDFETPDQSDPKTWFRVVRGTQDFMLRVVFEAPAGSGRLLGDVKVSGRTLAFGGQIAEKLRVRVRGIARPAATVVPALTCGGLPATANMQLVAASTYSLNAGASRLPPGINLMSPE
jgi:hypothetical protein